MKVPRRRTALGAAAARYGVQSKNGSRFWTCCKSSSSITGRCAGGWPGPLEDACETVEEAYTGKRLGDRETPGLWSKHDMNRRTALKVYWRRRQPARTRRSGAQVSHRCKERRPPWRAGNATQSGAALESWAGGGGWGRIGDFSDRLRSSQQSERPQTGRERLQPISAIPLVRACRLEVLGHLRGHLEMQVVASSNVLVAGVS